MVSKCGFASNIWKLLCNEIQTEMIVIYTLIGFYFCCYIISIVRLCLGFKKVQTFQSDNAEVKNRFSVIVPLRNEAQNISKLLTSFENINYPFSLFEIIFVDDDSTDDSASIINKWRMQNTAIATTMIANVRMSNSPKKDAINRAMPIAQFEWIITADADCRWRENSFSTYDNYIQKNDVKMIASSVVYEKAKGFLERFQQMDLISLQATTIGSFGLNKAFMANGANFAYQKSFFKELNGFQSDTTIASGDDVFLLQKAFAKYPQQVQYLKSEETIVSTSAETSWKNLFYQRVRWASKATSYQSEYGEMLAVFVFLGNLSIVVSVVLAVFNLMPIIALAALLVLKYLVDLWLLNLGNNFLKAQKLMIPFLSAILYPFFSVLIGLYILIFGMKYNWKGRQF